MLLKFFGTVLAIGMALAISACGNDNHGNTSSSPEPAPTTSAKVTVDELPTGHYIVSMGDTEAPTVGKYYSAEDGSRMLAVASNDGVVRTFYRRSANGTWSAVPPAKQDVQVHLLRSDRLIDTSTNVASVAGRYSAMTGNIVTDFSITNEGVIVAGSSTCKLSGRLSSSSVKGTLQLTQGNTAGCGTWPTSITGIFVVDDSDDAPARIRLLADDGSKILDVWAYEQ